MKKKLQFKYCENELCEFDKVSLEKQDMGLIKTEKLKSMINTIQNIYLNFKESFIEVDNKKFEFAYKEKFQQTLETDSSIIVLEKWINPYWKSDKYFYFPNKKNPIGKYLIILYSGISGKKLNSSIHESNNKFESGIKKNGSICINMDKKNIKDFFFICQLGASIKIRR